eukprot:CFRG8201T1
MVLGDTMIKRFGTLRKTMSKKLSPEQKQVMKPKPIGQSRTAQLRLANTFDNDDRVTCTNYTPSNLGGALRSKNFNDKASRSSESVVDSPTVDRKPIPRHDECKQSSATISLTHEPPLAKRTVSINDNKTVVEKDMKNSCPPKPKPRPSPRRCSDGESITTSTEAMQVTVSAKAEGLLYTPNEEPAPTKAAVPAPYRQRPPPPTRTRGNTVGPTTAMSHSTEMNKTSQSALSESAGTLPARPRSGPRACISAKSVFLNPTCTPTRPPPPSTTVSSIIFSRAMKSLTDQADALNITIGKQLRSIRGLSTCGTDSGRTVEDNRLQKICDALTDMCRLTKKFENDVVNALKQCDKKGQEVKTESGFKLRVADVLQSVMAEWNACVCGLQFVHSLGKKTETMSDDRCEMAYREFMREYEKTCSPTEEGTKYLV